MTQAQDPTSHAENGTVRIALRDLVYYYPARSVSLETSQETPTHHNGGNGSPALNHVSFTIYEGEYVAILGANGSGKSTLLKCINGLCTPKAGQVTIYQDAGDRSGSSRFGSPIALDSGRPRNLIALDPAIPEDLYRIRQVIGTLLQNPDDQIVGTVVEEDVAYGPENQGLPPEEIAHRVDQALAAVALTSLKTRPPQFLSGGERQRLALAGVLAMETPVLALDEAASMLDEGSRHALMDLLDELWKQGRTILHITHNLEDASRAQRCIVLSKGRLVFNGTPQDLLVHPDLERWGFRIDPALETVRYLARRFPGFQPVSLEAEVVAESLARYLLQKEVLQVDEILRPAAPVLSLVAAPTDAMARPAAAGAALTTHETAPSSAAPQSDLPPAVHCDRLSHTYLAGTAFAAAGLEDVSFFLPAGTHLALIGPSGSGKSTLLRHLNAILLPTRGQVAVFGQNTLDTAVDLRALRQRSALAVQNPESALFETYVADEVAYGPQNTGISGKELVQRVRSAMELVGLPYSEYRDRHTKQLSGGEKRRLALAGVLALDGDLLLLDEPSAALDGEGQGRVLELISMLKARGKTVISSTHSMEEAVHHDLVAVMQEGRIAALGRPADIFIYNWDPRWNLRQPWTVRFCHTLEQKLERPCLFPGESALSTAGLIAVLESALQALHKDQPVPDLVMRGEAQTGAAFHQYEGSIPSVPALPIPKGRRKTTGIEFFRNVNLGQFIDIPSPLRNLGAGYKIAATALILFAVILVPSPLFTLAVLTGILFIGKVLGHVGPQHLLRGLFPAAPYILFMVLVQIVFPWPHDTSPVLFHLGFINLSMMKITHVFMLMSRLAALMALIALFSAVTPMVESIQASRKLLAPLARFGIPVQDFMLIFGIALRFVPLLVEEAERIVIGQLSRGGGYQGRNKLRSGFALVVPLFLRALERSEVLATAMELRLFSAPSSARQ
ncbi:energy-coupling factor transporter ATPase [Gracilinema caldarium]|uniref:ABC transporter related protein n=1 Tax=Gracilinema caldarium (strain ATCC 51460 / DSM 7334 / H1) TaxID=744872 RepID=F8EXA8_GRAC1|nr:energy-coupling factor transporter ATPase [Gracilinema caldarium]AEJ18851.1 ABC transporter related protein [Gracilinema caldarium DSM 7334]